MGRMQAPLRTGALLCMCLAGIWSLGVPVSFLCTTSRRRAMPTAFPSCRIPLPGRRPHICLHAGVPDDLAGVRLPKYVEISQEALLAAAVVQNKKDDLRKLLDAGAPLEAISGKGRTALACAAVADDEESARLLLDKGAQLEALDDSGRTPLALAAAYGNFALVRFFVEAGANIEARDNGKMTALLWASVNGNEDVVRFLLDNGADIHAEDEDGMSFGEVSSSSADGAQASVYWGDFCRGQKDGSGICEWEEGSRYAGQWRAGLISGHGALTSDSGSRKYRGQWVHSKKHGRGVYTWPDGREHRGQYQLDTASGFGTFSWPDGKQYHGFWHNAHIIGPGVFSAPGHSDRPMEVDVNLFPAELKAELANQLDAMPLLGTLPSQSEQGELERTPDTKHRSLGITKADSQDAGVKSSVRQRTTANPFATVATPLRRFLAARGGA
ncbi:UACA [Symbiodinium microadriaticum]|nr:UACA [Symbiodinium microadriaticum]